MLTSYHLPTNDFLHISGCSCTKWNSFNAQQRGRYEVYSGSNTKGKTMKHKIAPCKNTMQSVLRSLQKRQNQNPIIKLREMLWVMLFIMHCWEIELVPKLILKPCHILSGTVCFLYFNFTRKTGPHMLENEWSKEIFYYAAAIKFTAM
jgi:hypothetical protein